VRSADGLRATGAVYWIARLGDLGRTHRPFRRRIRRVRLCMLRPIASLRRTDDRTAL